MRRAGESVSAFFACVCVKAKGILLTGGCNIARAASAGARRQLRWHSAHQRGGGDGEKEQAEWSHSTGFGPAATAAATEHTGMGKDIYFFTRGQNNVTLNK